MKLKLKVFVVFVAIVVSGWLVKDMFRPRPRYAEKAISAEISPTQGIKVVLDEEGHDWTPIFQLLLVVLGTYGGIRIINKYVK